MNSGSSFIQTHVYLSFPQFFSIDRPYVAVTEVMAEEPGQLNLVQDQPVSVLDSRRDDWWLVKTIPEDSLPPVEGWVPAKKLQPCK